MGFDHEDIEGWLVEEGIGFFDRAGVFHYGIDPENLDVEDCSFEAADPAEGF